jgi:hypothetical protein
MKKSWAIACNQKKSRKSEDFAKGVGIALRQAARIARKIARMDGTPTIHHRGRCGIPLALVSRGGKIGMELRGPTPSHAI